MPLILYADPFSVTSRFVTTTMEYLNLKYDLKYIDVKKGENLTPKFQAVNPLQSVPFLIDGNFKLSESKAIAMYLVNQYGRDFPHLYPQAPMERAKVDEALCYDSTTLRPIFQGLMLPILHGKDIEEENVNKMKGVLHKLSKRLSSTGFMALNEELTLADLCIFVTVSTLQAIDLIDLDYYEDIRMWLLRIKKEIPNPEVAYGRGIQKVVHFYNTRWGQVEEV